MLITDLNGRIFVCEKDIFDKVYEPVEIIRTDIGVCYKCGKETTKNVWDEKTFECNDCYNQEVKESESNMKEE
jgi:hypothetical protein